MVTHNHINENFTQGVQLYPTCAPEHLGEPPPVPLPPHHGRVLPPSTICRSRLGLDYGQV